MKLFGLWVAQNEGDIIRDTLEYFRQTKYYEKIFFYDLGSQDNTFEIAQEYKDILHNPQKMIIPYSGKLRVDLINQHRSFYNDEDWISIIDSDEFYAENPHSMIEFAEHENATRIETWQIMHHFTDVDLLNWKKEDNSLPIYERRLYYIINWSEMRFYKYLNPESCGGHCIDVNGKLCSRKLLNRHYPYRSPIQIDDKLRVRLDNRKVGGNAQYQIFSEKWSDYVVDHKLLHKYDGEYKFGIPDGVLWKKYYNFWNNDSSGWKNTVYNNTYIYWLMSHGFIRSWNIYEKVLKAIGKIVQIIRGRHRQISC